MESNQPILERVSLEGELVILRSQEGGDAAQIYPLVHGQGAVTDMLAWNGPADLAELEAMYSVWRLGDEDRATSARDYFFVIRDKASGKPVGNCGVRFVETNAAGRSRVGNIGYWLGEKFWGGGRMTEAVQLLLWLAFEKLQAESVEAMCLEVNMGSQRVLQKCGFKQDGCYDKATDPQGPHCGQCELRFELTRASYLDQPDRYAPLAAEIKI